MPRHWAVIARQQIREAFDYTPPLTIEHKANDGIDAVVNVDAMGVDVEAAAAPDANKVVPLIKNRP
jgi:hypothetical protein